MMLTLDNLAYRYHCLPSEALQRATTLDLHVLDVSTKWSIHRQDVIEGKTPDGPLPNVEQMKQMIANARNE